MGQFELVVVAPKRFPDPQADWRAAGATDVLDKARVVTDLDGAIEDCHWVVGTSTRLRKIPLPVVNPKSLAASLLGQPEQSKIAILFGREDNGLTNEELRRCHQHLQIDAHPDYPSLNLAMAVQVVCYEIYQASNTVDVVPGWDRPFAEVAQVEAMLAHLEETLTASGFLQADNPGQTMTRLRRLFGRVALDATEVQILRGIFKHLGTGSKK